MKRTFALTCLAAATLSQQTSVADAAAPTPGRVAQRYFVTNLGVPTGVTGVSSAWGINNRGQVVGYAGPMVYQGNSPPVLWTPDVPNGVTGSMVTLPLPVRPGNSGPFGPIPPYLYTNGLAWGINDVGQIAGHAGQEEVGLLWSPTSPNGTTFTMHELGPSQDTGYRINAIGQIAGRDGSKASLWSPTSPNTTTGGNTTLNNTYSSYAISDRGDVGGSNFLFRPSTPNSTTGITITTPHRIWDLNADGTMAAAGENLNMPGYVMRFSSDPTPQLLEVISLGADSGRALGLNNHGLVVTERGHAWSATDGLISLTTRLESHSGRNWTITAAREVNERGQIAARGLFDPDRNPATLNNIDRGLLLTPLVDGDADINAQVDFADLLILAQHYDETGQTWLTGDFTGDGAVGFDDLLALAQNYGSPPALEADWAAARALVPEPATAFLLAATFVPGRRRR